MSQKALLKAKGLHTLFNYLSEIPEGALLRADNVVIDRDGVIEPRRGFKQFGTEFALSTTRAEQLLTYKGRVLRHGNNKLEYDSNGSGTFVAFDDNTGSDAVVSAVDTGQRIKSIEANGNLYLTSSVGIQKVVSTSASNLSSSIVELSGQDKALDLEGTGVIDINGFLLNNAAVAYRLIWGIKDANGNLLLGAPSARLVISNVSGSTQRVDLSFTIPENITTSHFYQVYRSEQTSSATIDPGDELALVFEDNPTSAEITAREILNLQDITPDDFRGANLYSNPVSGEGVLQANDVPPLAKGIESFKSHTFYSNTVSKHRKIITLLGVTNLVSNVSSITIANSSSSFTYTFRDAGGGGEDATTRRVLLENTLSASQNVDVTARSLVKIINKQASENIYAFYLSSGEDSLPGQILLENRDLGAEEFTIVTDSLVTGDSFTPSLSPNFFITSISAANPSVVTSSLPHGLSSGDQIIISGSNSTPSIDGIQTVMVLSPTTFSVPVNVTVAGATGAFDEISEAEQSDNEVAPNRLFFSKIQQPEAVPLVNFFDIGPKDDPIDRIVALRDSLFIFKKRGGTYRLSGESSDNFTISLFDNTNTIVAPDSAAVLNNLIYAFSTKGIVTVSDTGVSIISRPIENLIIPLFSSQYTNFSTATFGVGYESDSAYLLWTVTETDDTQATQCFRFNEATNTWTIFPIVKTCGIVNAEVDKLYLGAGDDNIIEEERKLFSRKDHADREFTGSLSQVTNTNLLVLALSGSSPEIGDVLVQTQYLTASRFNLLLQKLDTDPALNDSDYLATLQAEAGDAIQINLMSLAVKLDADNTDGGYAALVSGSAVFSVIQDEFNDIVSKLNMDSLVFFSNYKTSTGTIDFEAVIDTASGLTVSTVYDMPFLLGPITLFKKIETQVDWAPMHFGDPSLTKQVSESTVIFETNNFTSATVSYGSDLSLGFEEIAFEGSGSGVWGFFIWGQGAWGGSGLSVPLRTYVPRNKQRCRFINTRFNHATAFEKYALLGVSYTFKIVSSRGYR